MRNFVVIMTMMISSLAYADRSISIASDEGKVTLINGSSVTVTYTAECFDKVTGTNLLTGASNVTLAAKASVTYQSAGQCASGSPSYIQNGIVACPGSVNFANAASLCGANTPLCTHANLVSKGVTSLQSFPDYFWFQASSDPFYMTWDNWGKSSPYPTSGGGKTWQPITYDDKKGSSYFCHTADAVGSPGTGIRYCVGRDNYSTSSGSLCCPTNNGFKSCKVTILSATPQSGYLQSPQFKGGAPF